MGSSLARDRRSPCKINHIVAAVGARPVFIIEEVWPHCSLRSANRPDGRAGTREGMGVRSGSGVGIENLWRTTLYRTAVAARFGCTIPGICHVMGSLRLFSSSHYFLFCHFGIRTTNLFEKASPPSTEKDIDCHLAVIC